MVINSLETERYCIAALLRHPKLFGEIYNFVQDSDFVSRIHRTVFSVIRETVNGSEEINVYNIAQKINNLGIQFKEIKCDFVEYLEEIKNISITETSGLQFFKELKKITVRREIASTAENIQKAMGEASNHSIDKIISMADKLYFEKISMFQKETGGEFKNLFASIEQMMEERGENPVLEFGFHGPFERYNYLYDAMYSPGDINLTAARSNVGKTSYGFHIAVHVAVKYNIPILWLDAGEMTEEQMMRRAVCSLTRGKVPTYYLKTGLWRKDAEMVRRVREVWPIVKKIDFVYKNIGGLSSKEICSVIRRYWLAKIGRFSDFPSFGNKLGPCFPVNYDYLKPLPTDDHNDSEWQVMGRHLQDLKCLVTQDVPACIRTYLQLNKQGITRGKSAGEFDDSESSFSMSDRIYHNVSMAEILRYKTMEELSAESQRYGNCIVKNVKRRDLGQGYQEALQPVRVQDGSLKENYIHLNQDSFYWEEKGDLLQSSQDRQNQVLPPEGRRTREAEDDTDLILD